MIFTSTQAVTVGFLFCLALSACSVAAVHRARNEMEESKAAYKKCLMDNQQDLSKCRALREAYGADLKAYEAVSGHKSQVGVGVETSP